MVLAGFSLAFSLMAWWTGGLPIWRGLVTSVGIGLLGLAFVLGPQPRGRYNTLIGISLVLCVLSLGFGIMGWW